MLAPVLPLLQNAHPRVRFSAWEAVCTFSDDHEELVCGEAVSSQLLPLFVTGVEDSVERVAMQCMEAFQHFGMESERESMEQVAEPMMQRLGQRLQGSRRVQKEAIAAVTTVAFQIQDGFAPYFPALMPVLKSLVGQILHKPEERELLGKAFECISMLAKAVGPVLFKTEAEQIMTAMIQATQVPNLPADDPVKEYMLSSAERICMTMKGDFLPFVTTILPFTFEKLAVQPAEVSAEKVFEDDDNQEVNMVQINGVTKFVAMSTSAA